jgi:hypothetical protein
VRLLGFGPGTDGREWGHPPSSSFASPTSSTFEALIYNTNENEATINQTLLYEDTLTLRMAVVSFISQPSVRLCVGHRRGRSNLRKFKKDAGNGRPRYYTRYLLPSIQELLKGWENRWNFNFQDSLLEACRMLTLFPVNRDLVRT